LDLKTAGPSFRQRWGKAIKIKPEAAEFFIHNNESTTNYVTKFHKTQARPTL